MAYFYRLLLLLVLVSLITADPDPLQDFCVADTTSSIFVDGYPCIDPTKATAEHFKTSVLSTPASTAGIVFGVNATYTTAQELPGMNTQGISLLRADYVAGGISPIHYHPRASEMIFILKGAFNVGFVDTNNNLYSTQLNTGDVFVVPRALVHYLQNIANTTASMLGAFNSQAPGAATISLATFASTPAIPDSVLAKSFQINDTEVDEIRKNLSGIGEIDILFRNRFGPDYQSNRYYN